MKIKVFLMAIICSLPLVGCATTQEQPNISTLDTNQNQEQQKEELKEEETEKKEPLKEEIKDNQEEVDIKDENNTKSDTILNLYTVDVDDYSKVIPFENKTFILKPDKSLEYNLQELCNILRMEYFKEGNDNAGIQVVSIDENKIATINLTNEEAWSKHFQGSAGAIITQETIVETLLQKQYQGDWIKGLKIQVDGKDEQEYDHISFIEPFMRDN